jgi:hypothetical protein
VNPDFKFKTLEKTIRIIMLGPDFCLFICFLPFQKENAKNLLIVLTH